MASAPPETAYNDLATKINDVADDGGAWWVASNETLTSQHTLGGQPNFFLLSGTMKMTVVMPDNLWADGMNRDYKLTFAACLDSGRALGLPSITTGPTENMGTVQHTVPWCGSVPGDLTYSSPIEVGSSQVSVFIRSDFNGSGASYRSAYVGHLSFVVSPLVSETSATATSSPSSTSATSTSPSSVNTTNANTASTSGSSLSISASLSPPPPTSSGSSKNEKKLNLAAIVGGTLSGLALIVVLLALIWYIRMRKVRSGENTTNDRNAFNPASFIISGGNSTGGSHGEKREVHEGAGWHSKRALISQTPQENSYDRNHSNGVNNGNQTVSAQGTNTGINSSGSNLNITSGSGETMPTSLGGASVGRIDVLRLGPNNQLQRLQSSQTEERPGEGDIGNREDELQMSEAGETLPVYESEYTQRYSRSPRSPMSPAQAVPFSVPQTGVTPAVSAPVPVQDAVGIWAQANRYLVSPHLEGRLRSAGYLPDHDPNRMSEDVWRERYGISMFELDTLKQLYSTRRQLQMGNN